ncbi:hypothetical protein N431DRAFT_435727 [Stipitochalara longipes BDJ]|nr:hypothetical protein N431DRAFT_435727 [Stipitochalara longipes BDJ]
MTSPSARDAPFSSRHRFPLSEEAGDALTEGSKADWERAAESANKIQRVITSHSGPYSDNHYDPPSFNIDRETSPQLSSSELFGLNEKSKSSPPTRATATNLWNIPRIEACDSQASSPRYTPPSSSRPPHSSWSSKPSAFRESPTQVVHPQDPETPRTSQTPFDEAIARRCSSRALSDPRNIMFFNVEHLATLDSPLNASILNSPFIPLQHTDLEDEAIFHGTNPRGASVPTHYSLNISASYHQGGNMGGSERQRENTRSSPREVFDFLDASGSQASSSSSWDGLPAHRETQIETPHHSDESPTNDDDESSHYSLGYDHYDEYREESYESTQYSLSNSTADRSQPRTPIRQEGHPPRTLEGNLSEASSCTLRHETPPPGSQLDSLVELEEWVPSPNTQRRMDERMNGADWDDEENDTHSTDEHRSHINHEHDYIEDRCEERWEVISHHSMPFGTPSTTSSRKRARGSDVFSSPEYFESAVEIERTPPTLKRARICTPSRKLQNTLEQSTTTTSESQTLISYERFQTAFNAAFDTWMAEHGKGIVEAAVKQAVREMMGREKVKREKQYEDVAVVKDSQGYTDDDEL